MSVRSVMAIVSALARYLRAHPAASDSLEGIARWWLDGTEEPVINEVNEALQRLVRKGVLRAYRAADGRTRYALTVDAHSLELAVAQIFADLAGDEPEAV